MAGKVKTRDRILKTALALFNEEGEAQVSTVEIAGVLDISPGNLYYHFPGKDPIIEALFADFEDELRQVLTAPINRPLKIEDNWIFLYIVFEEINDFRFFYNNLSGILERCPSLRGRFSKLLRLKEETALAVLSSLEKEKLLSFRGEERGQLALRIAAHLTFWLQFAGLTGRDEKPRKMINAGVYALLSQITPYVDGDRSAYAAMLDEFFAAQK